MPINHELTDGQVCSQVRELVGKGKIKFTPHALEKMESRGYSSEQVKECLRTGYFEEAPTIANRPGDIEYKFKMGARVDGEPISVVAALVPSSRVVVITVIDPNTWS